MPALKRLSLAALMLAFLASGPAFAEDPPAPVPYQLGNENTAVVVDEEAGVIRFFIKGKEMALIDETGLHVREEINFGATLTDYGTAAFDDRAAKSRGQSHEE